MSVRWPRILLTLARPRRNLSVTRFMALGLGVPVLAVLFSGCASAGGTAGIFDIGSVYYKHPVTGDVWECGGGFYPGVQIHRYNCGKELLRRGYVEVQKCEEAPPGALCVTKEETSR